jgi:outer membrane protein TolC
VSASYEGEHAEDPTFESGDFGSAVGVDLSYTLFDGNARRARVREAEAARDEAAGDADGLAVAVAAEVRESVESVTAAQDQLKLRRTNLDLATRNRDLVAESYAAGQAALVRLNEAQRDLTRAQSRLALARVGLQQAWYALRTATAQNLTPYQNVEQRP